MTTTSKPTPKWAAVLLFGYLAFAFIYPAYSTINQTGLGGYLIALELETFGVAYLKLTIILGFLILLAPFTAIAVAIEKLKPGIGARQPRVATSTGSPFYLSWKGILLMTAGALAITAAISGVFVYLGMRESRQAIQEVNLGDPSASLPGTTSFVKLSGVIAREYLTGYTERKSRTHVYVPITEAGWTPDEPVRFLIHHEFSSSGSLPSALRTNGPVQITGRIAGASLPVLSQRNYRARGVRISPSYTVIDWEGKSTSEDIAASRYDSAIMAGVIGFMIAAIMFFSLAMTRRTMRRVGTLQ